MAAIGANDANGAIVRISGPFFLAGYALSNDGLLTLLPQLRVMSTPHCAAALKSRAQCGHGRPLSCRLRTALEAWIRGHRVPRWPLGGSFVGKTTRRGGRNAGHTIPQLLPPLAAVAATIASLSDSKNYSVLDPSANVNL